MRIVVDAIRVHMSDMLRNDLQNWPAFLPDIIDQYVEFGPANGTNNVGMLSHATVNPSLFNSVVEIEFSKKLKPFNTHINHAGYFDILTLRMWAAIFWC